MEARNTKKLAVFFDGTWNSADQRTKDGVPCPTNITKLFEATMPEDAQSIPQIVHYVRGVGTRATERATGGGFGFGISDNIKEGYRFLVSNYGDGDQIFIFGFSRGAYTARSLAGLIRNAGILRREKIGLIDDAYRIYRDRSSNWSPSGTSAIEFREKHTWRNESIHFLGVFDTVGALGAPFGIGLGWLVDKFFACSFHDTQVSSIVKSAYHALALDERRFLFVPTLMTRNAQHNASNFEQKWFPGVHSDVGGGYANSGLSDLALDWMAEKAGEHGLSLDLKKIDVKFNPDWKADPNKSQTAYYQTLAVLTVKLPGCIGLVPKKYAEALPHLRWNGDYVRPIAEDEIGDLSDYIGKPATDLSKAYSGSLHSYVIDKMNHGRYDPQNVRRWIKR